MIDFKNLSERDVELLNKGVKIKLEHNKPSKKTVEELDKLNNTMVTKDLFEAKFEPVHEKLDAIIVQAKETNGRVKALEKWRSFLMGAWAILSVMAIPIFIYIYNDIQNQDAVIAKSIERAFNNYDIEYVEED